MRIIILRHGKPGMPAWKRIKAGELQGWIDAYNRAGIRGPAPPGKVLDAAKACNVIVTSDLARSIESGKALADHNPVISDGLFREAGLPFFPVGNIRLSPALWALFFRVLWSWGLEENGEPRRLFKERSRFCAERLIGLAKEHGSVLFAGHGIINSFIARQLLASGWTGPGRTPVRYWSYAEYRHHEKKD